jgi:hypothetical protein
MGNLRIIIVAAVFAAIFVLAGCPAESPGGSRIPVESISIEKNRAPVPNTGITLTEGESAELSAVLRPAGVYSAVYWQSGSAKTAVLSGVSGETVTVTGKRGGTSVIKALARNFLNDVYAEASVRLTVIPVSFFIWEYGEDGWIDIPANSAGMVNDIPVKAGGRGITRDGRGGLILDGTGGGGIRFIIGSTMNALTNSPFDSDQVFDPAGKFDFYGKKARVSIDYEFLGSRGKPGKFLRLQVNNNTTASNNASAISNWLVAEKEVPVSVSGGGVERLEGVFDSAESRIVRPGVPGDGEQEQLEAVLSHSFVAVTLPAESGSVLVRSVIITIE